MKWLISGREGAEDFAPTPPLPLGYMNCTKYGAEDYLKCNTVPLPPRSTLSIAGISSVLLL